jgi:hypothetical protein
VTEVVKSNQAISLKKTNSRDRKIELTFYIPEGRRSRTEVTIEVTSNGEITATDVEQPYIVAEKASALSLLQNLEMFDAIEAAPAIATEAIEVLEAKEPTALEELVESTDIVQAAEAVETTEIIEGIAAVEAMETGLAIDTENDLPVLNKVNIHINEIVNDIVPFFSLKLKNAPSIYKTGSTFLKDIANGKKHFGFRALSSQANEIHLLAYASFINYSLKQPVLVVVKDFNDKSFDKYRNNFTTGTLWKWKTKDWGNLCFIDYKQITKHAAEFKHLDIDMITNEFSAVLWSLYGTETEDELQKASLVILGKVNSVTLIVSKGGTKSKDLKKSADYYQCFDIPIKGILVEEELK